MADNLNEQEMQALFRKHLPMKQMPPEFADQLKKQVLAEVAATLGAKPVTSVVAEETAALPVMHGQERVAQRKAPRSVPVRSTGSWLDWFRDNLRLTPSMVTAGAMLLALFVFIVWGNGVIPGLPNPFATPGTGSVVQLTTPSPAEDETTTTPTPVAVADVPSPTSTVPGETATPEPSPAATEANTAAETVVVTASPIDGSATPGDNRNSSTAGVESPNTPTQADEEQATPAGETEPDAQAPLASVPSATPTRVLRLPSTATLESTDTTTPEPTARSSATPTSATPVATTVTERGATATSVADPIKRPSATSTPTSLALPAATMTKPPTNGPITAMTVTPFVPTLAPTQTPLSTPVLVPTWTSTVVIVPWRSPTPTPTDTPFPTPTDLLPTVTSVLPTPTDTERPVLIPTDVNTPIPTPTNTRRPTATATTIVVPATSTRLPTSTPLPTDTPSPTATVPAPTNTPLPTATVPVPTNTPLPTATVPVPTNTPLPPTNTPLPTATPTDTPLPPTNTPLPTATPTDTPLPPTNTPLPTATPTDTPLPTVAPINAPPVIVGEPPPVAAVDTEYLYFMTVSDSDGSFAELRLDVLAKPAWLRIEFLEPNYLKFSGPPSPADVGEHKVKIQVHDGAGGTGEKEFVITVAPNTALGPFADTTQAVVSATNSSGDTVVLSASTEISSTSAVTETSVVPDAEPEN